MSRAENVESSQYAELGPAFSVKLNSNGKGEVTEPLLGNNHLVRLKLSGSGPVGSRLPPSLFELARSVRLRGSRIANRRLTLGALQPGSKRANRPVGGR